MQPKTLNLLSTLKEHYPDYIMVAQGTKGKSITLFRIGTDRLDEEKFQVFLKNLLEPEDEETIYALSLNGLDIISPSAAKALVSGVVKITDQKKLFVVFTEVSAEALYGLRTVRSTQQTENEQQSEKVFWAVDKDKKYHLIGMLPDRLYDILKSIQRQGSSSASDLADLKAEESSKKLINRYSVYLQELYNTGLLIREKIVGSVRTDSERGWTYMYRPAYDSIILL